MRRLQSFLKSNDGPTAVEYAVMLGMVVVAMFVAISAVGTASNGTFQSTSGALESSSTTSSSGTTDAGGKMDGNVNGSGQI